MITLFTQNSTSTKGKQSARHNPFWFLMLRRKAKVDIDYKLFHTKGEKVPKHRTQLSVSTTMGESLKTLELQTSEDIEAILESESELDSLDLEDLSDKIIEMNSALKDFRHVHAQIKDSDSAGHGTLYPGYKDKIKACNAFIRDCKDRCKKLRSGADKASLDDLRSSHMIEVSVFRDRVTGEISGLDIASANISELKDGQSRCESLLNDYYQCLGRAKVSLRNDVSADLQRVFDDTLKLISGRISELREKIKSEKIALIKTESAEISRLEKVSRESLIEEHKFQASIVSEEIEIICADIKQKCDVRVLPKLSDQQIFDASKNVEFIDRDMRNVFDKITGLSKIVSICGDAKNDLLKLPLKHKMEALEARNNYMKNLFSIVQSRGVTEEKLKNASSLDVPISSFSGYDSKLDI